ncbi:MAG: MerR family transcriptional regulator [Actinobacteria bacterium]|nr:MerR family transcriptional regulator [Actinomycetota bacterium]
MRYYERLGLLPETGRTGGGPRYYDEAALERLRFIKGAQWFELRLDEIRELLELFDADGCACEHTRDVTDCAAFLVRSWSRTARSTFAVEAAQGTVRFEGACLRAEVRHCGSAGRRW